MRWVGFGVVCSAAISALDWYRPELWEKASTALLAVPALGMLVAWWQVGPRFRHPVLVALAWSLPMLAAPALLSGDVWAYISQGWMVTEGLDPYATRLGEAGIPQAPITGHWADTTSVYPPGSLLLFGFVWQVGGSPYGALLVLRLIHIAALLLIAWACTRLCQRSQVDPGFAVWVALNPLVIIHFIGGAHNEATLVAVLALAALAATRGGWPGMLLGGALVGAALLIKQSAMAAGLGIVAVAWAAKPGRSWSQLARQAFGAGAAAVAVFVAGSLLSGYGFGWTSPTAGTPLKAMSNSPLSWIAQAVNQFAPSGFWVAVRILTLVSGLLVVAALVWVVYRFGPRPGTSTGNPWAVLVGGLLAFALLGPALQPWYLTVVAPFVALARPSRDAARALLVGLGVAVVQPPLQIAFGVLVTTAAMIPVAWLTWRWLASRRLV